MKTMKKRQLIPPEPDFDMVEISGQTQKAKQRLISVEEEYIRQNKRHPESFLAMETDLTKAKPPWEILNFYQETFDPMTHAATSRNEKAWLDQELHERGLPTWEEHHAEMEQFNMKIAVFEKEFKEQTTCHRQNNIRIKKRKLIFATVL